MASVTIHQAIHGYRDGHRLLSSSVPPLGADSTRAMLVLSDMSGSSMYPGFEEYLTAYPLPGADFFVFAKTWYAPEMQRPGCVWTHSLLVPRVQVSKLSTQRLLGCLRRPQLDGVEVAANTPIHLDAQLVVRREDHAVDRLVAAALIEAVLGQPRPVVVPVDTAAQLQGVFLRVWEELWPSARSCFSFCTGALMPRTIGGVLMDLQAVPRAMPSSQFRKAAEAAVVVDTRAPGTPETWAGLLLDSDSRGDPATFQSWMESAAGAGALRGSIPPLMPLFGQWYAPDWSGADTLARIASSEGLGPETRARLVDMVFDRVAADGGEGRRRELLQAVSVHSGGRTDMSSVGPQLEEQTRRLFAGSRIEGRSLVFSLMRSKLARAGDGVLQTAIQAVTLADVEELGDEHATLLPALVAAKPSLAAAPRMWRRVGARSLELLAKLDPERLDMAERIAIVRAALTAGLDAPVEALVRLAGDAAVAPVLCAIAEGTLPISSRWRTSLADRPDAVLRWIAGRSPTSARDLEVISRFLRPTTNQERLVKIWESGMGSSSVSVAPRVAAFGLALALSKPPSLSPLLIMCFQPAFDAMLAARLDYEEWEWLRELAPPIHWWRDWDRCERVAGALARLLLEHSAGLETVFNIVRSEAAVRTLVGVLNSGWENWTYLRALRDRAAEAPDVGSPDQRRALLGRA